MRQGLVKQPAGFKTNRALVRAPGRVEQVITSVRDMAQSGGSNPDIVEQYTVP